MAAKKTFVIAEDDRSGFWKKHQEHGCAGADEFFQLLDCDNDGKARGNNWWHRFVMYVDDLVLAVVTTKCGKCSDPFVGTPCEPVITHHWQPLSRGEQVDPYCSNVWKDASYISSANGCNEVHQRCPAAALDQCGVQDDHRCPLQRMAWNIGIQGLRWRCLPWSSARAMAPASTDLQSYVLGLTVCSMWGPFSFRCSLVPSNVPIKVWELIAVWDCCQDGK